MDKNISIELRDELVAWFRSGHRRMGERRLQDFADELNVDRRVVHEKFVADWHALDYEFLEKAALFMKKRVEARLAEKAPKRASFIETMQSALAIA